jgi:hypothetical protein
VTSNNTYGRVCLGDFHLFEITVGFGDSCLCGATMIDDRGKTVPRTHKANQKTLPPSLSLNEVKRERGGEE